MTIDELNTALLNDVTHLEKTRRDLDVLLSGSSVENLTLAGCRKNIEGLTRCVERKRYHVDRLSTELRDELLAVVEEGHALDAAGASHSAVTYHSRRVLAIVHRFPKQAPTAAAVVSTIRLVYDGGSGYSMETGT